MRRFPEQRLPWLRRQSRTPSLPRRVHDSNIYLEVSQSSHAGGDVSPTAAKLLIVRDRWSYAFGCAEDQLDPGFM